MSKVCPHCGISLVRNGALSREESGRLMAGAMMGHRGALLKLIAAYYRPTGGGGYS